MQRKLLSLSTALALESAIQRRQCLVCAVQQQQFDRALFWFLEETYSDGPTISKLVESQGLCINHTRLLLAPENQRQMSFVAEILTGYNWRLACEALRRAKAYRWTERARLLGGRAGIGRPFVPRADCPFCTHLRTWEEWTLADLVDSASDPKLETASNYTCLPHTLMLIPLGSSGLASSLAESVRRRLGAMKAGDGPQPLQIADFFLARYPRATRSAFLSSLSEELLTAPRPLASAVPAWSRGHESVAEQPDWEALDWKACPLCQAVSAADASRFEAETYHFCRPHAAALLAQAPVAATQQLMEWAALAIERRLAEPPRRRTARRVKETACPACQQRRRNIVGSLAMLENGTPDRPSQARFCLPHLPLVLEQAPAQAAVAILEAERDLLRSLHAELEEFFRKTDYRFRHEPRGSEQMAWLRAADILAGSHPADVGYQSEFETTARHAAWTTV